MIKTYLPFLAGSLLFCSSFCSAKDPFFWTVEVGSSSFDIEDRYFLNDYNPTPEGWAVSGYFGYQFDNNWLVGGGLAYSSSSVSAGALDDEYTLGEIRGFAGYSFKLSDHFYLVPQVGISFWEFYTQEASLFGGDNEPVDDLHGTDIYGQLNAVVPVGRRLSITLSYTRTTTDPVRVSSTKLGLLGRF